MAETTSAVEAAEHDSAPAPGTQVDLARRKRRRRRAIAGAAAGVVVLLGAGAGAYAFGATPSSPPPVKKTLRVESAPIERGTLTGTTKSTGTLAYAGARDIVSGVGGVITSLPAPGTQIALGQALFAVDNVPVFLFHGDLPAWRAFEEGMSNGPDVAQLERSLAALGYFSREPDEEFTARTAEAIRAWQKATGQEKTGVIDLGRVVFSVGDVRVAAAKATVGAQLGPGSPVLGVTALDKKVDVDLKLADQQLATVGGKVTIDLPSGRSTDGTIASVGVPTEKESGAGKTVVIPVVVALSDPASVGPLQQASVTVNFPSEARENVLSVPVGALQALDGNRFGVEIVDPRSGKTTRVPVTTGLFAGGRVEITGPGIDEGQKVVVPGS